MLGMGLGLTSVFPRPSPLDRYDAAGVAPVLVADCEHMVYASQRDGRLAVASMADVLTLTRASTKTVLNASGMLETVAVDAAGFDWSSGRRGLLVELSATNLLSYSRDFAQSYWTSYAVKPTFTGGQTAPDGSATAMRWNCAYTTGGAGGMRGGILVVNTVPLGTATTSVWLKASAPLEMQFGQSDGTSQKITLTTSWQRFTYTNTLPNVQNRIFILYEDVNNSTYVYIWGAQTEIAAQASTNIYTSGAAATRAADVATIIGIPAGTYDVRVESANGIADLPSEAVAAGGYWPSGLTGAIYSVVAYPEGTL